MLQENNFGRKPLVAAARMKVNRLPQLLTVDTSLSELQSAPSKPNLKHSLTYMWSNPIPRAISFGRILSAVRMRTEDLRPVLHIMAATQL